MFQSGWAAFVTVFSLFAVLLTGANIWSELSPNLQLARVVSSVFVTIALAWPATLLFTLFDMRRAPPSVYRAWRWLWFFGLLAYAVHTYFAVGVWFEWDFAQIERRQGKLVAWTNYVLLGVWALEVLVELAIGARRNSRTLIALQWAAHLLFAVAFVVASVVFHNDYKTQASLFIGIGFAVTVGLAFVVRLIFGDSSNWSANAVVIRGPA